MQIDPSVKDWFQLGVWTIAILGGGVAAFRAIYEVQQNRRQRVKELRWRRANAAREILNQIHTHSFARNAVMMMDWRGGEHEYEIKKGERAMISYTDVTSALRKSPSEVVHGKEVYIHDCFDWFFYFVDRVEHYIRIELIDFTDVRAPFESYINIITDGSEPYQDLLSRHDYVLARAFFERFK